ncbi:uncharacterized protein BROUX77_007178 [Berkeleyomyces rouxiae]|uniref:uncharacterized protein n=1 Tax=Berkeleyomyces rouxiae TaxID=2035830 RepID=UPI003B7FBF26
MRFSSMSDSESDTTSSMSFQDAEMSGTVQGPATAAAPPATSAFAQVQARFDHSNASLYPAFRIYLEGRRAFQARKAPEVHDPFIIFGFGLLSGRASAQMQPWVWSIVRNPTLANVDKFF